MTVRDDDAYILMMLIKYGEIDMIKSFLQRIGDVSDAIDRDNEDVQLIIDMYVCALNNKQWDIAKILRLMLHPEIMTSRFQYSTLYETTINNQ